MILYHFITWTYWKLENPLHKTFKNHQVFGYTAFDIIMIQHEFYSNSHVLSILNSFNYGSGEKKNDPTIVKKKQCILLNILFFLNSFFNFPLSCLHLYS